MRPRASCRALRGRAERGQRPSGGASLRARGLIQSSSREAYICSFRALPVLGTLLDANAHILHKRADRERETPHEQMRRVHRHSAVPFNMDNGQTIHDQNRANSAVPR